MQDGLKSFFSAQPRLSRREFLGVTAGVSGALLLSDPVAAIEIGAELPTYRFRVRRDRDLLSLEFSFVNFERVGPQLRARGSGRSLVIVRFPPQNLAEALFDFPPTDSAYEVAPLPPPRGTMSDNSPEPPIRSYLSGPSWLVFIVPDGLRLPLEVTGDERHGRRSVVDSWLRTMADWKVRVPRGASTTPSVPAMPRGDETCLEIPFRLFIAPTSNETRWLTSSERLGDLGAHSVNTRELWHAALLSRKPLVPAQLPPGFTNVPPELLPPTRIVLQARAVFSPDYQVNGEPAHGDFYPGKMQLSLEKVTRHCLVKQMAEGNGWIDAEHLILTALGCDTSLSYTSQKRFDDIIQAQLSNACEGNDSQLAIWKHRIVVGRDVFFVEAYMGFLFPFVYPALAVSLTRRQFAARQLGKPDGIGPPAAYLLKQYFILVQDPLKQFAGAESTLGRNMPIKKALLTETRSPLLADWNERDIENDCIGLEKFDDDWTKIELNLAKNQLFFIPRHLGDTGNDDGVRWTMNFEDGAAQSSKTTDACLLFAQNVVIGRKLWQKLKPQFRKWQLPAQPVSFAPEQAELSILADQPMSRVPDPNSQQGAQPVRKGQVLFQLELAQSERLAARTLADLLRRGNVDWSRFLAFLNANGGDVGKFADNLQTLLKANQVVEPDEKAALKQLTLSTLQRLASNQFSNNLKNLQDPSGGYQEFLRQLQRAQQVTSTLETHLLEFDSTRIDKLVLAAQGGLVAAAEAATDLESFKKQLASYNPDAGGEGSEWLKRIGNELDNRIDGIDQHWETARHEVIAYANELNQAANNVQQMANGYFQGQLASAQVVVPALKALAADTPAVGITLLQDYVSKGMGTAGEGFSRVQNGAFAQLAQAIDQGAAMADNLRCGVARPAAVIAGLSRDLGALTGSGPDAISQLANQFVESGGPDISALKNAVPDAKLFGVLPLRELVAGLIVGELETLARNQLPQVTQRTLPDHFESNWQWTTKVTDRNFGFIQFKVADSGVALHISSLTRITTPKTQAEATKPQGSITIQGFLGFWDEQTQLGDTSQNEPAFDLIIAGLVDVAFYSVEFSSLAQIGHSADTKLKPHMGPIEFLGPLKFIKTLEDFLSSLLGDAFHLTLTPEFIEVGFAIVIPPITSGAVTMRNIAIGASLRLSFTGEPLRFGFNFASQEKRFELAVMCFGGTAYLNVWLLSNGQKLIDGAFEFGGVLAFDATVASGELVIAAGFYFKLSQSVTDLSGGLRACGCLSVLGLIHATVEFRLFGRYRIETLSDGTRNNQIYGVCTITVSIDLFLYSFDVSIVMEKKIAGSTEPPENQAVGQNATTSERKSYFRFASNRSDGKVAEPVMPKKYVSAYFDRDWRDVKGRFKFSEASSEEQKKSIDVWDREYWSQFSLQ
jgi:hypothetical protein